MACTTTCYRDLYRPAISLYERRAALKRLREQGQRAVDESAVFGAIEAMQRISDGASKETKLQRRHRERQRRWQEAQAAPDADASSRRAQPAPARRVEGTFSSVEEWG